ncbi:MAG TPA: tetratricopeptide repeat protein [Candidatus Binataceae bacterium]
MRAAAVVEVPLEAAAPRLSAIAAIRIVAIVIVLAMLAPVDSSARSSNAAARAPSDHLVDAAEALILRAGKRNPVDTALIHQGIDKLREALRADPDNDAAYVDLGFCYGVLRDAPTAVDMYLKATRINPSGANYKELADIYLRTGDAYDALLAANAGLQKEPRNARLYNAKGMALNDLTRFPEAAEAFEKASRLDPTLKVARTNLDALNGRSTERGSVAKHASHTSAPPPAPSDPN